MDYSIYDAIKVGFGNDYSTPDRYCIRNFINVVDLAKAYVAALERIFQQKQKSSLEILI